MTVDLNLSSGDEIPIEERDGDEVRAPFGKAIVPGDYPVRNPAFDVTPASLITGIVTDVGVLEAPYAPAIAAALKTDIHSPIV